MSDKTPAQAAEDEYPDRPQQGGGYRGSSPKTSYHSERTAFIKGAEWQASQSRVLSAEEIMELFDEAVEASTEHGDEDDAQDWFDITDVGVEFRSRLNALLSPHKEGS